VIHVELGLATFSSRWFPPRAARLKKRALDFVMV
jgi:hypothetical protein